MKKRNIIVIILIITSFALVVIGSYLHFSSQSKKGKVIKKINSEQCHQNLCIDEIAIMKYSDEYFLDFTVFNMGEEKTEEKSLKIMLNNGVTKTFSLSELEQREYELLSIRLAKKEIENIKTFQLEGDVS